MFRGVTWEDLVSSIYLFKGICEKFPRIGGRLVRTGHSLTTSSATSFEKDLLPSVSFS